MKYLQEKIPESQRISRKLETRLWGIVTSDPCAWTKHGIFVLISHRETL